MVLFRSRDLTAIAAFATLVLALTSATSKKVDLPGSDVDREYPSTPEERRVENFCTGECTAILDDCIRVRGCDNIITDPTDEERKQQERDEERRRCLEGCWNYADGCHQHCLALYRSSLQV